MPNSQVISWRQKREDIAYKYAKGGLHNPHGDYDFSAHIIEYGGYDQYRPRIQKAYIALEDNKRASTLIDTQRA